MKQKRNPLTGRWDIVGDRSSSTPLHLEVVDQLPETGEDGTIYIVEGALYSTMYVWDSNTNTFVKVGTTKLSLQEQSDRAEEDPTEVTYIKNKPILAPVATSNNYEDLDNKPDIGIDTIKAFRLTSLYDLETAQEIYNRAKDGKTAIINFLGTIFVPNAMGGEDYRSTMYESVENNGKSEIRYAKLEFIVESGTVTGTNYGTIAPSDSAHYLDTEVDYGTPYSPQYPGSPATKKYVDGKATYVGSIAPSNPTEGAIWYDTTNDKLMAYDGTYWNIVGDGNVKGPISSVDGHIAVFDGISGKTIKDGGVIPEGVPSGGTEGQVLTVVSGEAAWANVQGTGDVIGPNSSLDGTIVLFNGTTGKRIKNSGLKIQSVTTEPTGTRVDVYYNNGTIYLFSSQLGGAILAENGDFLVTEDDKDIVLESS